MMKKILFIIVLAGAVWLGIKIWNNLNDSEKKHVQKVIEEGSSKVTNEATKFIRENVLSTNQ